VTQQQHEIKAYVSGKACSAKQVARWQWFVNCIRIGGSFVLHWQVWLYDVSKQGFGSIFIHFSNIFIAILLSDMVSKQCMYCNWQAVMHCSAALIVCYLHRIPCCVVLVVIFTV
jgi:hypothetical protein